MEDTAKYLIRANVTADGVVERSDVVGAIFGQTEGLLGDELDLRDLRQSQKVGRIDVEITSAGGTSSGSLTIATSLDKVETATLAASLETITRVGPCHASLEVEDIEDVRAAKRRDVVDRAKELLRTGFDDSVMSSEEILAEVREYVRVEDITEYEGLPAGPRVTDSDAIIIVEGRADVLTLLKYGVKNAIAVEGTNVPDAVAELTRHRTVTAFLDGDRGGDLILEELAQVGNIDYVTFAPADSSVEDLDHTQLFTALRNKVPYESVAGSSTPRDAIPATDGSVTPAPAGVDSTTANADGNGTARAPADVTDSDESDAREHAANAATETVDAPAETPGVPDPHPNATTQIDEDSRTASTATNEPPAESEPLTLYEHATDVIRAQTETVRLLDAEGGVLEEADASAVDDLLEDAVADDVEVPSTIVLDGILSQQLLDIAADAGVDRIIARSLGQFTKRPSSVQVYAIDDVASSPP
ncbi:DNA primase DnaG [Halobacteria archaeon AArc-curdl1]|uniref:DNA primase DnaG n=1 Tax=Natronosalvus hydrolyticus TaxID=2979988 RepID=A0AAP2Z614_9EURY|nr:DNA primase DnaG [Halobacteria archaeon AArc-curdl1]